MPQGASPEGGWVDGQHLLIRQFIIHKVQPQMGIHSFHQVLHTHTHTHIHSHADNKQDFGSSVFAVAAAS